MDIKEDLARYDAYLNKSIEKDIRDTLKERAAFFAVDIYDLDGEAAAQGARYAYIGNLAVVQNKLVTAAAMALSTVEAKIKQQIRGLDPRDGRKGGPTIDEINSSVKTNPTYLEALVNLRRLEDDLAHLRADEGASRQKAKMLELIIQLMKREARMKPYSQEELEEGGDE